MLKVYTDGAFDPQTKQAGIGIQVIADKEQTSYKYYVAHAFDNHVIEFMALRQALTLLAKQPKETLLIYSDSKVLVDSIEKAYVKSSVYRVHLTEILAELEEYPLYFVNWLADGQNRGADQLARQALRRQGQYEILSDF